MKNLSKANEENLPNGEVRLKRTKESMKSAPALCKFYLLGQCSKGTKCTFLHRKPSANQLCKYFVGGFCRNGDKCTFSHTNGSDIDDYDMIESNNELRNSATSPGSPISRLRGESNDLNDSLDMDDLRHSRGSDNDVSESMAFPFDPQELTTSSPISTSKIPKSDSYERETVHSSSITDSPVWSNFITTDIWSSQFSLNPKNSLESTSPILHAQSLPNQLANNGSRYAPEDKNKVEAGADSHSWSGRTHSFSWGASGKDGIKGESFFSLDTKTALTSPNVHRKNHNDIDDENETFMLPGSPFLFEDDTPQSHTPKSKLAMSSKNTNASTNPIAIPVRNAGPTSKPVMVTESQQGSRYYYREDVVDGNETIDGSLEKLSGSLSSINLRDSNKSNLSSSLRDSFMLDNEPSFFGTPPVVDQNSAYVYRPSTQEQEEFDDELDDMFYKHANDIDSLISSSLPPYLPSYHGFMDDVDPSQGGSLNDLDFDGNFHLKSAVDLTDEMENDLLSKSSSMKSSLNKKKKTLKKTKENNSNNKKKTNEIVLTVSKDRQLCNFHLEGNCRYGPSCRNIHGEVCHICSKAVLVPDDEDQKKKHIAECYEKKMTQEELEQSIHYKCSSCNQNVVENNKRFGLLTDCVCCFCLQCIKDFRSESQNRECPVCKVVSHFVVPSNVMVINIQRKKEIIEHYKVRINKHNHDHDHDHDHDHVIYTTCALLLRLLLHKISTSYINLTCILYNLTFALTH
eukprot:TRINITY_DN2641_c0_g1_i3.p1 TRINITY_DN2641_c0_g1~~TRINITY_DN2641_c0_g1_i3.p1  ORF type:complete len:741 (+),score=117.36 TRINITY_DN2641_c0_g1_i3:196-2418(+)